MLSAVIPSEHSYSAMRLRRHNRYTRRFVHSGPLVLGADPLKFPAPTVDRTEPSHDVLNPARAPSNGEQPHPWDLLQPQDEMSRHRGANTAVDMNSWRYQPVIPRVPLSAERWPFHTEPPDH